MEKRTKEIAIYPSKVKLLLYTGAGLLGLFIPIVAILVPEFLPDFWRGGNYVASFCLTVVFLISYYLLSRAIFEWSRLLIFPKPLFIINEDGIYYNSPWFGLGYEGKGAIKWEEVATVFVDVSRPGGSLGRGAWYTILTIDPNGPNLENSILREKLRKEALREGVEKHRRPLIRISIPFLPIPADDLLAQMEKFHSEWQKKQAWGR